MFGGNVTSIHKHLTDKHVKVVLTQQWFGVPAGTIMRVVRCEENRVITAAVKIDGRMNEMTVLPIAYKYISEDA